MKNLWTVLVILAFAFASCQMDTTAKIPTVKSISNDRVELDDGTSLELANVPGGQSTILLIRHADKESEAIDSPLNAAGYNRTVKLDSLLRNVDLKGILATPYKRAIETAQPVADSKKIPILNYDSDQLMPIMPYITEYEKGGKFLMIGHSNTIPLIAKALVDTTIMNIPVTDYDDLFIITVKEKGEGTFFHYKY